MKTDETQDTSQLEYINDNLVGFYSFVDLVLLFWIGFWVFLCLLVGSVGFVETRVDYVE